MLFKLQLMIMKQFRFIQGCARECVDGKHTEGVLSTYQKLMEDYNDWSKSSKSVTNIPASCRKCSNHPSNGGSGICNCTLGQSPVTCTSGYANTNTTEDLPSTTVTTNLDNGFDQTKWVIDASARFDTCKHKIGDNKCSVGGHPIVDCSDCITYKKNEEK